MSPSNTTADDSSTDTQTTEDADTRSLVQKTKDRLGKVEEDDTDIETVVLGLAQEFQTELDAKQQRIDQLEEQMATEDYVADQRTQVERKLGNTRRRVTDNEETIDNIERELEDIEESVTVESMTKMERYLVRRDSPKELSVREKRAWTIAMNFRTWAGRRNGNLVLSCKAEKQNLTNKMRHETEEDLQPAQVHRAMETLADWMDGKIEMDKGNEGANRLKCKNPDEVIWDKESLQN